jgi:hypothetical protein
MAGNGNNDRHWQTFAHLSSLSPCLFVYVCQIGSWKYKAGDTEDIHADQRRTTSSWFCIRIKDVSHIAYDGEHAHQAFVARGIQSDWLEEREELVYGRFHHFVQLGMSAWNKEYLLGRCTLYRDSNGNEDAGLAMINLDRPLTYASDPKKPGGDRLQVKYVRLRDVVSPVALAPHINGIKKVGEAGRQGEVEKTNKFYVMPLCH